MAGILDDAARPLLGDTGPQISSTEKAADKVLVSAANLITQLPTTAVLAFQLLSSTFTDGGNCYTANKYLTGFLLGFCGISCIFSTFTDSYKAEDGKLYYGIATIKGLWTLNSQINKTVDLSSYKLTFVDFVHAVLSVLVFACVALMDPNVVNCYYAGANANANAKQLINNLPLGVGFVCSVIFVAFPTTRHGIGYAAAT